MANKDREDEPFAFEAREFLRTRASGRKCEFHVEYCLSQREVGTLFVEEQNMNLAIAGSGFVKVMEKRFEGMQVSKWHDQYVAVSEECKKKSKGIFNPSPEVQENHRRKFISSSSEGFNPQVYVDKQKKAEGPFKGIVEYVFNGCSFNLYFDSLKAQLKVNCNHVFSPAQEKAVSEEAKAFTEKRLLGTDVFVTFQKVDDYGNLQGKISHPNGEIALHLVEEGLAKVQLVKTEEEYDEDFYKSLKDA